MIKPIITNTIELKLKSGLVKEDTDRVHEIIRDMIDTAESYTISKNGQTCIGLAANQIGELLRIIIIRDGPAWKVMINPEWEALPGKEPKQHEQCLSRPGVKRKIKRHKRILVRWVDVDGEPQSMKATNLFARVIQHECDHLDGIYI
jgi:peptide deformylase